jgi:hypothetical protein
MKNNKQLYKTMRKVKFNNFMSRFNNLLEKELREYVSDDVIYSHTYWNENDMLTENIHNVKDIIIDSVIRNKYKKVFKI